MPHVTRYFHLVDNKLLFTKHQCAMSLLYPTLAGRRFLEYYRTTWICSQFILTSYQVILMQTFGCFFFFLDKVTLG